MIHPRRGVVAALLSATLGAAAPAADQVPVLDDLSRVNGHDAPASGAVWVTASGIVLRTKVDLNDALSGVKVTMVVAYARDSKLAGWFPVRMDETYTNGFSREHISCVATYSNYRRFETSARIVDNPSPGGLP